MVAGTPDWLEHGQALVVAGDGLTIDQAGPPRQGGDGGRSQRKPAGEIVAVEGD